jgi:hypothetical protein
MFIRNTRQAGPTRDLSGVREWFIVLVVTIGIVCFAQFAGGAINGFKNYPSEDQKTLSSNDPSPLQANYLERAYVPLTWELKITKNFTGGVTCDGVADCWQETCNMYHEYGTELYGMYWLAIDYVHRDKYCADKTTCQGHSEDVALRRLLAAVDSDFNIMADSTTACDSVSGCMDKVCQMYTSFARVARIIVRYVEFDKFCESQKCSS